MAFVSRIANANQSAASQLGQAARDRKSLAGDFSNFLKLLTTQLQNQNPTDPLDSNEFTNQLVQFTGVEQQIRLNQNVENLTRITQLGNIGNVASYLNNEALIQSAKGAHSTEGIKWQYSFTNAVDSSTLSVRDSDGKVVFTKAGEKGSGSHNFTWDGKNNQGQLLPAGTYELRVGAKDAKGKVATVTINVRDKITAVETTGQEPVFTIGPNQVKQSRILKLFGAPAPQSNAAR